MHEEIPIRYPYLVTPLNGLEVQPEMTPPAHEHTATSLLLEDVDMEDVNVDVSLIICSVKAVLAYASGHRQLHRVGHKHIHSSSPLGPKPTRCPAQLVPC